MASPIPGPLDGPPPSPALPPPPGQMGPQGPPIMPPAPQDGPMPGGDQFSQNPAQGLAKLGAELDRGLTALASVLPAAAPEFRQAKMLIQAGLAKALSGLPGGIPSVSPTATGIQFPGGMGGSFGGV